MGREGDGINRDLARLVGRDPSGPDVQAIVAHHRAWIEHFWIPTAESYRALGRGCVEDPRFPAFLDGIAPGRARFPEKAIAQYCGRFPV